MERSSSSGKRAAEHADAAAVAPASKASRTAEATGPCNGRLQLKCAVSADKGTRTTMEDVHVCLLDHGTAAADATDNNRPAVSHFAVYDGHGGASCAQFVAQRLHEAVLAAGLLTPKRGTAGSSSATAPNSNMQQQQQQQQQPQEQQQQPWQLDVKAAKQAIIKVSAIAK
ncbi:hypothetical protein OEZ86_003286 [Tetradesmus obliquus]|nr:hypothetical protein OEZ86_003286 [Tetradesmus obliquus]